MALSSHHEPPNASVRRDPPIACCEIVTCPNNAISNEKRMNLSPAFEGVRTSTLTCYKGHVGQVLGNGERHYFPITAEKRRYRRLTRRRRLCGACLRRLLFP